MWCWRKRVTEVSAYVGVKESDFRRGPGTISMSPLIEQNHVPAGPSNKAHFVQLFRRFRTNIGIFTADVVDYARNRMKLKVSG